jgi:hypothetical protein
MENHKRQFHFRPDVNPKTQRKIKKHGPTYNQLVDAYGVVPMHRYAPPPFILFILRNYFTKLIGIHHPIELVTIITLYYHQSFKRTCLGCFTECRVLYTNHCKHTMCQSCLFYYHQCPQCQQYLRNLTGTGDYLFLKDLTGKTTTMIVDLNTFTVDDFISLYEIIFGHRSVRIIFAGGVLVEGKTLKDYRLSNGSTLHVVMKLRGD